MGGCERRMGNGDCLLGEAGKTARDGVVVGRDRGNVEMLGYVGWGGGEEV